MKSLLVRVVELRMFFDEFLEILKAEGHCAVVQSKFLEEKFCILPNHDIDLVRKTWLFLFELINGNRRKVSGLD